MSEIKKRLGSPGVRHVGIGSQEENSARVLKKKVGKNMECVAGVGMQDTG